MSLSENNAGSRGDKTIITLRSSFSGQQSSTQLRSSVNYSSSNQEESPLDIDEDGPSGSASWPSLLPESSTEQEAEMAPQRPNLLPKDRFALVFGSLKTQSYYDPIARAPGSHTYVFL